MIQTGISQDLDGDGGSVVPVSSYEHVGCIKTEGCRVHPGLTIRDYFAGQALACLGWEPRPIMSKPDPLEFLAARAYLMADAMLKARGKK